MHIVHIITRLIIGGAQENTVHTCEDHHRAGEKVTLITGLPEGPEGSLLDRAHAGGYEVVIVPQLVRSIRPFTDSLAYRKLVSLLRKLQPDIVHTHTSKAGILGRAAAYRTGLPAVHTIHGASFHYGQSPLAYHSYVAAERLAARWTDHFISVADAMTNTYLQAGIGHPEQFTTIYSGFDVDPFFQPPRSPAEIRRELGFSEEHLVVGMVGRLFHLKGHEFLLAAAPAIVAAVPNVRFLLVGGGILRQQIENEIAANGLTEHFVFTGMVPPTRIPELIWGMDIVIHTSQWEGLARVLPQGLAAGKPVISYDVGGAGEVVIPSETGYLLPRDSVTPLIEAVIELSRDPDLRRRLGENGRNRFADRFRHQTMSSQILEVYQSVLEHRRHGPLPRVGD